MLVPPVCSSDLATVRTRGSVSDPRQNRMETRGQVGASTYARYCPSRHQHSCTLANAKGNSPLTTKKALIKCFKRWIEPMEGQTVYCLADREFGSKEWFDLLKEAKIRLCIRLKKNALFKTEAQAEKQARTASPNSLQRGLPSERGLLIYPV